MTLSATSVPQTLEGGSDRELVLRARRGEAEALGELAQRHRRSVYLLALQLLGNPDDAMDATQDTLLRFLRTLRRFDASRPVRPWLYAILRNRVRDLHRRRRVRKHDSIDGDEDHWRPELVDPVADPHDDVTRHELRERVWRALAELAPSHREIVVLRDYQDLSYAEIARVLDIPQGTVMSRLHRARRQLAILLVPATAGKEEA
jgi:RNA polymerase sigma-70 factor (ECF subfamily)